MNEPTLPQIPNVSDKIRHIKALLICANASLHTDPTGKCCAYALGKLASELTMWEDEYIREKEEE